MEFCRAGPILIITGRIINRFSKDIGFLDDVLPYESYQYTNVSYNTVEYYNNSDPFTTATIEGSFYIHRGSDSQPMGRDTSNIYFDITYTVQTIFCCCF